MSREDWRRAEDFTAGWLRKRGWRILARNWRWRRLELDIVANRGDTLAFVEVKMASRGSRTMIPEKLDRGKQDRISRAAAAFLAESGISAVCRFDLAMVRGEPGSFRMDYMRAAFRPGDRYTL